MKSLNTTLGLKSSSYISFDSSKDIVTNLKGIQGSTFSNVDDLINKIWTNEKSSILSLAKTRMSEKPYLITSSSTEAQIKDAIGDAETNIAGFKGKASSLQGSMYDVIYGNLTIGKSNTRWDKVYEFISKDWLDIPKDKLSKLRSLRVELVKEIKNFLADQVILESLTGYLVTVQTLNSEISKAIKNNDIDLLNSLKSQAKTNAQKDAITKGLKDAEDLKKQEQAKKELLDNAKKKIDNAKTEEERKQAEKEYENLLKQFGGITENLSNFSGIPKGAIYLGIGLTVAIVGFLVIRGVRK
jgi:hypothetical protein